MSMAIGRDSQESCPSLCPSNMYAETERDAHALYSRSVTGVLVLKLCLCLSVISLVPAIPITSGLQFAVAIPKMITESDGSKPTITFVLSTLNRIDFKVLFQSSEFSQHITLSSEAPIKYSLEDHLMSEVEIGRKSSYSFVSERYAFGLMVHMSSSVNSASSLTALPVKGWGTRYFTVHLRKRSTLQVISSKDNNSITISLVIAQQNVKILYEGHEYSSGNILHIALYRFEAFALSMCPKNEADDGGDMTSTLVSSNDPIGVVSGSCRAPIATSPCSNKSGVEAHQMHGSTAEMLMPLENLGTEFIVVTVPLKQGHGEILITGGDEDLISRVQISSAKGPNLKFLVGRIETVKYNVIENAVIRSDLPVQVIYIQNTACDDRASRDDYVAAALSLVVPISQFYVSYMWSTPDYESLNFAVTIIPADLTSDLIMDSEIVTFLNLGQVVGDSKFEVGHVNVTMGSHHIYSSKKVPFGCYLWGYTDGMVYMHPAGFQDCKQSRAAHEAEDRIDNDCDGLIDEEIKNGVDDDNDTLIDEDLQAREPVNGSWGAWSAWRCSEDCSRPKLYRVRECDKPRPMGSGASCDGVSVHQTTNSCAPLVYCPSKVCEQYSWGPRCSEDCSHCATDCNKLNGSCLFCKSGFKDSTNACNEPCDDYEWGENCIYSCFEKCWADCSNRETGACSPVTLMIAVLPWVLLAGTAVLLFRERYLSRKKRLYHRFEHPADMIILLQGPSREGPARSSVAGMLDKEVTACKKNTHYQKTSNDQFFRATPALRATTAHGAIPALGATPALRATHALRATPNLRATSALKATPYGSSTPALRAISDLRATPSLRAAPGATPAFRARKPRPITKRNFQNFKTHPSQPDTQPQL